MSKHTLGPWMARQMFSGSWDIAAEDGDGSTIARTKDEANASLIAAAPDLLEACERVREQLLEQGFVNAHEGARLEAAIAKAEGRE